MLEKARCLAMRQQDVVFIIAHEKSGPHNGIERAPIEEHRHFLLQYLKSHCSDLAKIRFEFVNMWKVLPVVNSLLAEKKHIMVDEFSFDESPNSRPKKISEKISKYLTTLIFPPVSLFTTNRNTRV